MMPAMMLSLVLGQAGAVGLSARVSSWIVGSVPARSVSSAVSLVSQRVGRRHPAPCPEVRRRAARSALIAIVELGVELVGAVLDDRLAEDVGEVLGRARRWRPSR